MERGLTRLQARRQFAARLLSRLSMLVEADTDSDGFSELMLDYGLEWEEALPIAQRIADQLARRSERLR